MGRGIVYVQCSCPPASGFLKLGGLVTSICLAHDGIFFAKESGSLFQVNPFSPLRRDDRSSGWQPYEGSTLCVHTFDFLIKKLKPVIYLPNWKRKLRFGWGGGFKFGACEESSLQLISPGVKWYYPQERLENCQENLRELKGDLAKILQEPKRKIQRCWVHPQGLHQLYR